MSPQSLCPPLPALMISKPATRLGGTLEENLGKVWVNGGVTCFAKWGSSLHPKTPVFWLMIGKEQPWASRTIFTWADGASWSLPHAEPGDS